MPPVEGRTRRGPAVADAMRTGVITIDVAAPISAAAERMRRFEVGCLPILENGVLVGMVTDRDLVVRGIAAGGDLGRRAVGEVMSTGPLTIHPEEPVEAATRLMIETGVRRLIVIDRHFGRLAGLLSWDDLGSFSARRPRASEVGFYRRIHDSHGHPHRIETYRLYLAPGIPPTEVEPLAIERFEHVSGNVPWRLVADDYEVASG